MVRSESNKPRRGSFPVSSTSSSIPNERRTIFPPALPAPPQRAFLSQEMRQVVRTIEITMSTELDAIRKQHILQAQQQQQQPYHQKGYDVHDDDDEYDSSNLNVNGISQNTLFRNIFSPSSTSFSSSPLAPSPPLSESHSRFGKQSPRIPVNSHLHSAASNAAAAAAASTSSEPTAATSSHSSSFHPRPPPPRSASSTTSSSTTTSHQSSALSSPAPAAPTITVSKSVTSSPRRPASATKKMEAKAVGGGSVAPSTPANQKGNAAETSTKQKIETKEFATQTDVRLRAPKEVIEAARKLGMNDEDTADSLVHADVICRDVLIHASTAPPSFQKRILSQTQRYLAGAQTATSSHILAASCSAVKSCDQLVQVVMDRACRSLSADSWAVYQLLANKHLAIMWTGNGTGVAGGPGGFGSDLLEYRIGGKGITVRSLLMEHALIVPKAKSDELYCPTIDREAESIAAARMFNSNGGLWGALQFIKTKKKCEPFSQDEAGIVEDAAVMSSLAIAALEEKAVLAQAVTTSHWYSQCMRRFGGNPDLHQVMAGVEAVFRQATNAQRATLWLHDHMSNHFYALSGNSIVRMPVEQSLPNTSFADRSVVKIDDCLLEHPTFIPFEALNKKLGLIIRTLLLLPLKRNNGKAMGVIQLINKLSLLQAPPSLLLANNENGSGSGKPNIASLSSLPPPLTASSIIPFSDDDVVVCESIAAFSSSAMTSTELFNVRSDFGLQEGEVIHVAFWAGGGGGGGGGK